MTIFLCKVATLALVIAVGLIAQPATSQVWPDTAGCDNIDPQVVRDCISKRMQVKQEKLRSDYARALAAVKKNFAAYGKWDNRANPRNFVRAHKDWQAFVESSCLATGAFGGGSNTSISERIEACREFELDRRIKLYEQISDGSYGL